MKPGQNWLSVKVCAARLAESGDATSPSTLSRYLQRYGDEIGQRVDGRERLVDFEALKAHRADNPHHRMKRDQGADPSASEPGSRGHSQARKLAADAEMREMDLEQRRRQLTPTAEVSAAADHAVTLMRDAFDRAIEKRAATMAAKHGWGEREARAVLKAFAAVGLDAFDRELRKPLNRDNGPRAD